MLVLSRKKGEDIVLKVGDEVIVIKACRLGSDKVRLGFEASDNVTVIRGELPEARALTEHVRSVGKVSQDAPQPPAVGAPAEAERVVAPTVRTGGFAGGCG